MASHLLSLHGTNQSMQDSDIGVSQQYELMKVFNMTHPTIEVFKILNGYENIDRNIVFSIKEERRTRGHGITLAKKLCRLDIRKFSYSERTVN